MRASLTPSLNAGSSAVAYVGGGASEACTCAARKSAASTHSARAGMWKGVGIRGSQGRCRVVGRPGGESYLGFAVSGKSCQTLCAGRRSIALVAAGQRAYVRIRNDVNVPQGGTRMTRLSSWLVGFVVTALSTGAVAADIDWSKVDEALGRKGAAQPGGVYKFSFPRSDLKVSVDGVAIKPPLALGSWA